MCLTFIELQRYSKVDLQVSNNILHIRTCADSCRALQNLILYLANDGDLNNPDDSCSYIDDDISVQVSLQIGLCVRHGYEQADIHLR